MNSTSHLPFHSSSKFLSIFYFNARSLLPKLDEHSTLSSLYSPDVICVVETWLSSDIADSEIALPTYRLYRLDRNRHSGGIVVYVKSFLAVSPITLPSPQPIELLLLSVKVNATSVCFATFYRPPSSDDHLDLLLPALASFSSMSQFANHELILQEDFNVDYSQPSSLLNKINAVSDLFSLVQVVHQPTHYSHSGSPSTIDLVFVPSFLQSSECQIFPPVSNSDHNSLMLSIPLCSESNILSTSHRVWFYDKADFSLANQLISSIPWESILPPSHTDVAWIIFKELFLRIMHKTIPSEIVYPLPCPSRPWVTQALLRLIKSRNLLFSSARSSGSPALWSAYRNCRNRSLSLLRSLKRQFFNRLSSSPTPCSFWSSLRKLRKSPICIPTLTHNSLFATSPETKAKLLNSFFFILF